LNELLTANAALRNQEIATKLALRERTIRNYLLRVYDKLRISSRGYQHPCVMLGLGGIASGYNQNS
jgi:Bacterial regulatory proteins, luxR family